MQILFFLEKFEISNVWVLDICLKIFDFFFFNRKSLLVAFGMM